MTTLMRLVLLAVAVGLLVPTLRAADAGPFLWELGKPDHNTAEFALAPADYAKFQADGFFIVGQSDPRRDWPYAHPGPADAWGGAKQHIFTIAFGLKSVPKEGDCTLRLAFVDTQWQQPPRLRIALNDRAVERAMPKGSGDDSAIFGQPAKGKPFELNLTFPAAALRPGLNQVSITTLSGSWVLYDWIGFAAPAGGGAELAPGAPAGTFVRAIDSAPALVRGPDSQPAQAVRLSVLHVGAEADAVIRVDGKTIAQPHLRPGANTLEATLAAVSKETTVQVAIDVAGQPVAAQAVTLKPVRPWVVYLLPHSHNDIGYTHVQTEVLQRQWAHTETAIAAAVRTKDYPEGSRFKWNIEVLWAVDHYLRAPDADVPPAKKQALIDAIKAGYVELDALYGNELTGLCRDEELLRLIKPSAQLADRCGVPLEVAMISDVPGYTWGLVTALAHSGVKYFSCGPNGGDRIGWTLAAWGDKPFYWIGPSGKDKVLVWVAGTGYHYFHSGTLAQRGERAIFDHLQRLEAANYPYDMVQLRYNTGGDNGPPDPSVCDAVKAWNEKYAYPKLVIATASQMFHDFEKRYADQVPQVKGDFTPYWEDGAASTAAETRQNRAAAERLSQAEALWAMLAPAKYPAAGFTAAWRDAVLYDEHTWGAHNSISQPDSAFAKQQWAIKQAFAVQAEQESRDLLAPMLPGVVAGQTVNAIDVVNTSSWPRTDLVLVPKDWALRSPFVVDAVTNQVMQAQRLSTGELAFVARDVPPFGAKRYTLSANALRYPVTAQAQAAGNTLTSPALTVRIDEKTGAIASLRRTGLDAEFVDSTAPVALNDYVYLPGSDPKGALRNGPVKITVLEPGPVVAALRIECDAPGCNRLTRDVRLVDGLERVDLFNAVDKQPVRTKEGVHFGFGFRVPDGVVRMGIPWAVARVEADQMPGACRNWVTAQRFMDVSNDTLGVTWATVDAPLVEVGGLTANLLGSQTNPKAWIEHLAPSQTLYSWAMNNHWHTNYKADQDGVVAFRYALRPHGLYDPAAAQRLGFECSQPLLVQPAAGEAPAASRLRIEPANAVIATLKPSDDGQALIVRLFGASGKDEKVTLTWSDPVPASGGALYRSDNREKPGAKLTGPIDVPGFGLVTVRAELPR